MKVRRTRKAFTLVEILIVVVILGILAAIVVPQFTRAADEARTGNIDTQISTIENQLELFRARTGAYPTLAEMQADVTVGPAAGASDWGIMVDNDYLKEPPVNPVDGSIAVFDAAGSGGWIYTAATGTIEADGAP